MRPRFPLDIQYRVPTPPHSLVAKSSDWVKPWRARYRPTARLEYRLVGWGVTMEEALADLNEKVAAVDRCKFRSWLG